MNFQQYTMQSNRSPVMYDDGNHAPPQYQLPAARSQQPAQQMQQPNPLARLQAMRDYWKGMPQQAPVPPQMPAEQPLPTYQYPFAQKPRRRRFAAGTPAGSLGGAMGYTRPRPGGDRDSYGNVPGEWDYQLPQESRQIPLVPYAPYALK